MTNYDDHALNAAIDRRGPTRHIMTLVSNCDREVFNIEHKGEWLHGTVLWEGQTLHVKSRTPWLTDSWQKVNAVGVRQTFLQNPAVREATEWS